jgi:hypothetical protein
MNDDSELKAAEAGLGEAERDLAKVTKEVEAAEEKIEAILHHDQPYRVEVIYNGVPKPFEVRHDELVKTLLDKALAAFGPIPQPHLLSIWKGGDELQDVKTLEQSGVKPGDNLLLRPSKVKGGS